MKKETKKTLKFARGFGRFHAQLNDGEDALFITRKLEVFMNVT